MATKKKVTKKTPGGTGVEPPLVQTSDEFLDAIRELELDLFSREFRLWLREQNDDDRRALIALRTEVASYRANLETQQLRVIADKLEQLAPELGEGLRDLQRLLDEMARFTQTMEAISRVLGLISRIVTLVA